MAQRWHTFPAQMGEHRAFITFDESFASEADKQPLDFLVRVRAVIKKPSKAGMPTDKEFPALRALDEKLERVFAAKGGRFVGNVTVDSKRYFYYYVTCTEETAVKALRQISRDTGYDLSHVYENDADRQGYWKDLYPTPDDWQMIKDLRVLDALRDRGDANERPREVSHWAYFADPAQAARFVEWLGGNDYKIAAIEPAQKGDTEVRFSHVGTMVLEDITRRTIGLNRKARELNGEYDGWETSVER